MNVDADSWRFFAFLFHRASALISHCILLLLYIFVAISYISRYISEFSSDNNKKTPTDAAKDAYEEATKIAVAELLSTHPIRLGLALNFSVFYYEILNQPGEACQMARQAFDDAISELDNVSEESYRDSTLIMQLLRDNLTLWTTDVAQAEAPPKPEANEPKKEE